MATISVEQIAEAVEVEFARLRVARPALSSRIERAENILITHLSCPKAGIIRPRIRGGELVAYLVKGSGASGAVYRVKPGTFDCSCPDYHRRGKGCKHGIACYALGRAFRPALASRPTHNGHGRRCGAEPKITRHEMAVREPVSYYAERECVSCLSGHVYDERAGWVSCEECSGTGRALVFVYPEKRRLGRQSASGAAVGSRVGSLSRSPRTTSP